MVDGRKLPPTGIAGHGASSRGTGGSLRAAPGLDEPRSAVRFSRGLDLQGTTRRPAAAEPTGRLPRCTKSEPRRRDPTRDPPPDGFSAPTPRPGRLSDQRSTNTVEGALRHRLAVVPQRWRPSGVLLVLAPIRRTHKRVAGPQRRRKRKRARGWRRRPVTASANRGKPAFQTQMVKRPALVVRLVSDGSTGLTGQTARRLTRPTRHRPGRGALSSPLGRKQARVVCRFPALKVKRFSTD
jgi:hypothetical protein